MSVQNGERLATKQDLADMYQGILPYLGGMPEVVANKFSKGDLYSTEEKMIGQWTDGKPLYSKTFNSTTGNTPSQTLMSNLGSLNFDTMVSMTGKLVNSGLTVYIPAYLTATGYVGMYHNPSGNSIVAFVGSDWYNQPVTITLQYTKTTDTAISIGEATEYSTEEKIVGTWIDGKPLYQKSFKFENLTLSNSQQNIGDISGLNAEIVRVVDVCAKEHSGADNVYYYPLGGQISVWCRHVNSNFGVIYNNSNARPFDFLIITIQYTKTTT